MALLAYVMCHIHHAGGVKQRNNYICSFSSTKDTQQPDFFVGGSQHPEEMHLWQQDVNAVSLPDNFISYWHRFIHTQGGFQVFHMTPDF